MRRKRFRFFEFVHNAIDLSCQVICKNNCTIYEKNIISVCVNVYLNHSDLHEYNSKVPNNFVMKRI